MSPLEASIVLEAQCGWWITPGSVPTSAYFGSTATIWRARWAAAVRWGYRP